MKTLAEQRLQVLDEWCDVRRKATYPLTDHDYYSFLNDVAIGIGNHTVSSSIWN